MAEFASVLSPIIFWKIENFRTSDRKSSPTFRTFGLRWKLRFTRIKDHQNKEVVEIYLECLSRRENLETKTIYCDVKNNKSSQTTSVLLNSIERCVWRYYIHNLVLFSGAQVQDLCFMIKLYPSGDVLDEQLFITELSKQVALEKFPYLTRLNEDIGSLYNNPELSDFELKCGQLSLAVHKAILAARCGYFAASFRSPLKESDKKFVELQNIDPDILQLVIQYLYTEHLPKLPLDSIRKVYAVADMFLFESLKMKCRSLMIDSFVKKDQLSLENGAENQEEENSQDGRKQELVKQLFSSREWGELSEEFPALVEEMCKPILLGTVEI